MIVSAKKDAGLSDSLSRISLRRALVEDEEFLFKVYAATRREEIAGWGLDAAQQEMFLRMQFRAQQFQYEDYDDSGKSIIMEDDGPIGRLIVSRSESEIHLVDIALLPEHRSGGIGTKILEDLFNEASERNIPLRLEVSAVNRAAGLYKRLGFRIVDESETYLRMEWRSAGQS